MNTSKAYISRTTTSAYECAICNNTLNFIQVLNDDIRVQEEYFLCPDCKKRYEASYVKEEDVPEYSR